MTIKELLYSISRREWRFVFYVAAIAMAITSLPPLYGWLVGIYNGTPWTGIQFWAPGDFTYYLSLIDQARGGALLSANRFTTTETVPALNVLWWAVGRFAALFSLGSVAAYYVFRALLIPVLGISTYFFVAYLFKKSWERLIAFVLLFFSSGLGVFFYPFFSGAAVGQNIHQVPVDMSVAEAHLFASMSYSPHFVASWICLLMSALLLLMAFDMRRPVYGMIGGTVALVLFQFHPYHAPTLYLLGGIYLLVYLLARAKKWWKQLFSFVLFVYFSAPSLVYHYITMSGSDMGREIISGSFTPTPHPIHLIIGFGVFIFLAPFGGYIWFKSRRDRSALIFAVAWIASCIGLSYAGFVFERRLLQGLSFPLIVLSMPAILLIWRRLQKKLQRRHLNIAIVVVAIFLLMPTLVLILFRYFDFYTFNRPPLAYFSASEAETVQWIRHNTPQDATFYGGQFSGGVATGWAGRKTFFGHWVNSGNILERRNEMREFISECTNAERAEFMRARDIGYVYFSPREKTIGEMSEDELFERVFRSGEIEIFKLR